jgi:type IV pilus assembly protein PilB
LSGWTFRRGFLDAIIVPAAFYLQNAAYPRPATVRLVQVDLKGFEVPESVLWLVPASVARENVLLPIGVRERTLVMAARDPFDADTLTKVEFILNRDIELVAADGEQVVQAIDRFYGKEAFESVTTTCFIDSANGFQFQAEVDDSPVSKLIPIIIREAQAARADQIRMRPCPDSIQILYRIDQKWIERDSLPRRLLNSIVAGIRLLANLSTVDGGALQTGQLRAIFLDIPLDLAVQIEPTAQGPSITLTFLPTGND